MIMDEPGAGEANDTKALFPNARAKVDILHVEKVFFIHAANAVKEVTADQKAGAHNPIRIKRRLARPRVLHEMTVDASSEHTTLPRKAPRYDIEKGIEASR